MQIKIHSLGPLEGTGHHVFDCYYAYLQHLYRHSSYRTDVAIDFCTISDNMFLDQNHCNVLWCSIMYSDRVGMVDLDSFDIILIENGNLHIDVTNPTLQTLLARDNCWFVGSSFLGDNHPLKPKVIFHANMLLFKDLWQRSFYPQMFDVQQYTGNKNKKASFVNGSNRCHRAYFIDLLIQANLPGLDIVSNFSELRPTLTNANMGDSDLEFALQVNSRYAKEQLMRHSKHNSLFKEITVGINGKFGTWPLWAFVMPEFEESHMIIFPETAWTNWHLAINEKIYKCLVYKNLPFPVAGAKINQLYNRLGIHTAWNLLPKKLQSFDDVENHAQRYDMMIDAIRWILTKPNFFDDSAYRQLVDKNHQWFYTNSLDIHAVRHLQEVFCRQSVQNT